MRATAGTVDCTTASQLVSCSSTSQGSSHGTSHMRCVSWLAPRLAACLRLMAYPWRRTWLAPELVSGHPGLHLVCGYQPQYQSWYKWRNGKLSTILPTLELVWVQFLNFLRSELIVIKHIIALDTSVFDFLSLRIGSGKPYRPYQSVTLCTTVGGS